MSRTQQTGIPCARPGEVCFSTEQLEDAPLNWRGLSRGRLLSSYWPVSWKFVEAKLVKFFPFTRVTLMRAHPTAGYDITKTPLDAVGDL